MATRHGQTGWVHEDYKVQREFERLSRQIANISKETPAVQPVAPTVTTVTVPKQIPFNLRILSGIVYVNQLPLNPANRPMNSPSSLDYKYENYGYNPSNGFYGWYCYQVINHNLNINPSTDYLLELIDLHETDTRDGNDSGAEAILSFSNTHPKQGLLECEPLDNNNLIIRGVYKPYLYQYKGGSLPEQHLVWLDESNRIIRTNMIFRYTIFTK